MSENAVTRKPTDTEGVRRIIAKVKKHTLDRDNPHEVTAHQVGAYTQQETEDRINDALSGEVGSWLGNMTVAQVNALTTHRKGDSATMTDSGTVNPGNVSVTVGDDIMWVDTLEVWQKKVDAGLKIMPPADSGTNTMVFYKGVLHG